MYLLMLWEQRRHMAKLVSVVERRVTSLVIEIVLRRKGSVQNVKKYGHFPRCCKNGFKQHSAQTNPSKQPPVHRRGPRQLLRGKGREANLVDEVTQSSEDNSFAFTIEEQTCALSNASEPVVTVKIGGISKEVLVDCGFASNLI